MLRVTVLGSGTVDPRPHRASSGFHLHSGEDRVQIDFGAGTLRNALIAGFDMPRLGIGVLTHFHPDHTSDLVPFLFARKYATGEWPTCPPLRLYGPRGTHSFLEAIFLAWPSLRPASGQLEIQEVEPGETYCLTGDLHLSVFPAEHGDMTALSLRFSTQGKVIAFSGDTALCPGVVQAASEADLFLCECSCFPRGVEPLQCRKVHLSWEDVAEICQQALPRELVLTHLYEPVLERKPDPAERLREVLTIPVSLATDTAQFDLF